MECVLRTVSAVGFLLIFAFFFLLFADHRHLHSFPTRRSSDLCRARGALSVAGDECLRSFRCRALRIDRKSTRLNSSHSSISYAVFCLKKKIRGRRSADTRIDTDGAGSATTAAAKVVAHVCRDV